jgi:hypothetical protein
MEKFTCYSIVDGIRVNTHRGLERRNLEKFGGKTRLLLLLLLPPVSVAFIDRQRDSPDFAAQVQS